MKSSILIETQVNELKGSRRFARKAIKYFKSGDTILLYGTLGSGKTFLIKEFTALLGSKSEVSSPSFSLINRYEADFIINHVDLYRINNAEDLINLGLEDLWNNSEINFIEWPNIIEKQITWTHYRLFINTDPQKENWRKFILAIYYE
jgi:tRNA threonylcarbamoyladenosine biosynthesis protein TsaE